MKKEAVRVTLKNADVIDLDSYDQVGGFAVHRRIQDGTFANTGWSITHRATGRLVWSVADYADALKAARWLDDSGAIPVGRDECLAWVEQMNKDRVAFAHFVNRISTIAPRLVAV